MQTIKYLIILVFAAIYNLTVNAQALSVVNDVELLNTNIYAARNFRPDGQGRGCAVMFVHSTIPNLRFEGKTVGDINYEGGTYYVYLEPNTSKLDIYNNENHLQIKFPKVQVKTTYQTTIEYVEEYGFLNLATDPSGVDVQLILNDQTISLGKTPIKGNVAIKVGVYQILLTKNGFVPAKIKNVKISPNKTTNLGTKKIKKQ